MNLAQILQKIPSLVRIIPNSSSQKRFTGLWVLKKSVIEIQPDVIGMKRQLTSLLAELWVAFLDDLTHRLNLKLLQYLTCLLTCSGAVADLVFHLGMKLGQGLTYLRKGKNRVIAKTIFSLSLEGNHAMTLAIA